MSEAALSAVSAERAAWSEDWLAVVIGLAIFALALLSLVGARRARLARDDVGLDRSDRGARARLEGLCRP